MTQQHTPASHPLPDHNQHTQLTKHQAVTQQQTTLNFNPLQTQLRNSKAKLKLHKQQLLNNTTKAALTYANDDEQTGSGGANTKAATFASSFALMRLASGLSVTQQHQADESLAEQKLITQQQMLRVKSEPQGHATAATFLFAFLALVLALLGAQLAYNRQRKTNTSQHQLISQPNCVNQLANNSLSRSFHTKAMFHRHLATVARQNNIARSSHNNNNNYNFIQSPNELTTNLSTPTSPSSSSSTRTSDVGGCGGTSLTSSFLYQQPLSLRSFYTNTAGNTKCLLHNTAANYPQNNYSTLLSTALPVPLHANSLSFTSYSPTTIYERIDETCPYPPSLAATTSTSLTKSFLQPQTTTIAPIQQPSLATTSETNTLTSTNYTSSSSSDSDSAISTSKPPKCCSRKHNVHPYLAH